MSAEVTRVKKHYSIIGALKVICAAVIIFGITMFIYNFTGNRERYEKQSVVVKNIKDMGELNVKELNSNCKLVDYEGNKTFNIFKLKFGIPGTWHRMSIVFDAKVKAAVDLSRIKRDDVKVAESKAKDGVDITIKLKKPYISSVEISNPEVFEDHGLFRLDKDYSDVVDIYNKKMKKIARNSAIKADLLQKARTSAEKQLKAFIKTFMKDANSVSIDFSTDKADKK